MNITIELNPQEAALIYDLLKDQDGYWDNTTTQVAEGIITKINNSQE